MLAVELNTPETSRIYIETVRDNNICDIHNETWLKLKIF